MSNKKQTAVEWLWGQIKPRCDFDNVPDSILEQAKEIEKQQIISFGYTQIQYIDVEIGDLIYQKVPEEIYNETYGGNNG